MNRKSKLSVDFVVVCLVIFMLWVAGSMVVDLTIKAGLIIGLLVCFYVMLKGDKK